MRTFIASIVTLFFAATLPAAETPAVSSAAGVKITIGGYVHADARAFGDGGGPQPSSTFLLRRVRAVIDGTAGDRLAFRVMPDFGGGATVLQDAWAELKLGGDLKLRAGKFKAPVGLERLMSATDLLFIERGLPTALVPNRDIGVQLSGSHGQRVAWAAALMNGVADGSSADVDTDDEKDFAARLMFKVVDGLSLGASATFGTQSGTLPVYRTAGQQILFAPAAGTVANGRRTRFSPQFQFSRGRGRLIGEYVRSRSQVQRSGESDDLSLAAWQVAGGFSVRTPLEVVGRYGRFSAAAESLAFADASRSAEQARHAGIGVNWMVNRNLKWSLDWDRTSFQAAAGARPDEDAVFARMQLKF